MSSRVAPSAPTSHFSGLVDASGEPIPATLQPPNVADLPLIAADALPPLPDGIEARLLDGNWYGNGPEIVVYYPARQTHVNCPLADKHRVTDAAIMLMQEARQGGRNRRRARQARQ